MDVHQSTDTITIRIDEKTLATKSGERPEPGDLYVVVNDPTIFQHSKFEAGPGMKHKKTKYIADSWSPVGTTLEASGTSEFSENDTFLVTHVMDWVDQRVDESCAQDDDDTTIAKQQLPRRSLFSVNTNLLITGIMNIAETSTQELITFAGALSGGLCLFHISSARRGKRDSVTIQRHMPALRKVKSQ